MQCVVKPCCSGIRVGDLEVGVEGEGCVEGEATVGLDGELMAPG